MKVHTIFPSTNESSLSRKTKIKVTPRSNVLCFMFRQMNTVHPTDARSQEDFVGYICQWLSIIISKVTCVEKISHLVKQTGG